MSRMEREKSQPYQIPYYDQNRPNRPEASIRKNERKIPFKKFLNAPWEANIKQKEAQKDVNTMPNTR